QIVGRDGVDKRIDVLATALRFERNIFDLQELELAYAPPYSSAKDPVNMAGFTAGNIINEDMKVIHWWEIDDLDLDNTIILDIRTEVENQLGAIEGSTHIPLDELRDNLNKLPTDKDIVLYCQVGLRGYIATRILLQNGFTSNRVRNLSGGYRLYKAVKQNEETRKGDNMSTNNGSSEENSKESKEEVKKQINEIAKMRANDSLDDIVKLDACGLQCPGPIMQVYRKMDELETGDIVEVTATDPAFGADIESWCDNTGNTLLDVKNEVGKIVALIKKGSAGETTAVTEAKSTYDRPDGKTLVVFSDDLDRAIASFIIANGAASMGKEVTMFFTFWGLNVLRKDEYVDVEKGFMDKMFSSMMPRGSKKLGLSKMNMMGMGRKMMRKVMENKNVDSLEALIGQAKLAGVNLVACQMSMDVMGIKKEELIDGVELGGVATYLNSAEGANLNLFI
ncbi:MULTISPECIES: DsrE/DsrF/DrsH-like family protein, partial [unclassified Candidatus Frackibacter]|uniref:DsrE/DsrF/DrsH-like family protein n=1 Tax=unclassified Candidatus Frackibacter TaxID=2648818 RepID=UPI0008879098